MSHNRHTSSLRRINKPKKRSSKSASSSTMAYETLEPRQLLAVDIGAVNVVTGGFGFAPDLSGGVGPNHIVEVSDQGFKVFDKFTGAQVVNKPLDQFWTDTGGAGAESNAEMVGNTANARVLYDVDTRRWFISSSSEVDLISGTGAEGPQKPVLLAVSRSSDPTQDWQSLLGFYDHDNNPMTPLPGYDGGVLPAGLARMDGTSWSTNLSVDDHNVYLTVASGVGAFSFAFNKFESLVVSTPNNFSPTITTAVTGTTQWATDVTGTVAGSFALETNIGITGGTSVILKELTNAGDAGAGIFAPDISIPVDPYLDTSRDIRQEFDPDLLNAGTGMLNSAVRHENSMWAVHAIRGDFEAQNPDGGITVNSAVRWYEIDLDTKTVKQSGTIQHEWQNYIYPSIAVTSEGNVAISYTSTGVNPAGTGLGIFPSATVSIGYSVNGVMTFEDPFTVKDGEGGYLDGVGNFWGQYMDIVADPFDPTKVWMFSEWANNSLGGQTQMTELILTGHSPTVNANALDNVIVVRRSAIDNSQIEVEIDGVVVASYQETKLESITLDGGGGNDTFVIDTSNGEFDFVGGVNFIGDDDDTVLMNTTEDTNWRIFVDGSGEARVGTNLPGDGEDTGPGLNQAVTLNFEAGSQWFDATSYTYPNGSISTRGEVLRTDLQNYFNDVIAPIFENSFSIELDINDDAVDSLAASRALGYGFEDVNGQDLWVGSPWSIMTGRGDRTVGSADAVIDYNLDLDLYQNDFEALRRNIAGGLTRSQFINVLGMEAEMENHTTLNDPRGDRGIAGVMEVGFFDINDNPVRGNYSATDSMFDVLNYQTNAIWAGDNSGIYFLGVGDDGLPLQLPVNSNTELIDFDTIASSLAGTSRNGSFHDIIEQDRAFLRGLGIELAPLVQVADIEGLLVQFSGIDQIQAGSGEDFLNIRSSNVDLEIKTGDGNDYFKVTGLGVGAIDLFGEGGDDTYEVVFSPAGVITIGDSVASENDTLIGLGTFANDTFVFDTIGTHVNGGLLVYRGLENISFDGRDGDDVFEADGLTQGLVQLIGGDGVDTFGATDEVATGPNNEVMFVSVNDPLVDPVDELRLRLHTSGDTYLANSIENLAVDGSFVVETNNGTPTVAGGLNLLGDGNERLQLNSTLDAAWVVDGDGSGNVTIDVEPMTFVGFNFIRAGNGIDTFNISATNTDLLINTWLGDDIINIAHTGVGIVTVDGSSGKDSFTVTSSGATITDPLGVDPDRIGGVILGGNTGSDSFTYNDTGSGTGVLNGEVGRDTFNILNSGQRTLDVDGGVGVDVFNINNPTGTAVTDVLGGDGNDLFNVINSGLGKLTLQGQVGDDTYSVTYVDPSIEFSILDSPNAEFDTLNLTGTDGDDVFNITGSGFSVSGSADWVVVGIENYGFDGLLGNDTFNIDMGDDWDGNLDLRGGGGNDAFVVNNGGKGVINLDGGVGSDSYTVHFTTTTDVRINDSGTLLADSFFGFGTAGVDTLTINSAVIDVDGGKVTLAGVESVQIDALGEADVYEIVTTIGNSTFLGGSENDIFNVRSTTDGNRFEGGDGEDIFNVISSGGIASYFGQGGMDVFNVMNSTGGGTYNGGDDVDQFNIEEVTGDNVFNGDAGNDFFEITNHLAKGSVGSIQIDGGDGQNRMKVNGYTGEANFATVTNNSITGMSAVPIQFSASGSFSRTDGEAGGIELIGSDGFADGMRVNSLLKKDSLSMFGGGGTDLFTVAVGALGKVSADGQEDSDLYRFEIGSDNNRFLFALDSGVDDADRIIATLTDGDDTINLSGESFAVGTDNFGFNKNIESMIVDTKGGNDTVDINRMSLNFLRVTVGAGDDQINVNNFAGVQSILLQGVGGNDGFFVNSGTVEGVLTAHGGDGNDKFVVSQRTYGNTFVDGQEGSDEYEVFFADRSDRYVVARDSGVIGTDNLTIHGTILDDRLTLRSGIVKTPNQRVFHNHSTETMTLMTAGSSDNVSIYGVSAPTTNIMTQDGHDLVFLYSSFGPAPNKTLNIDLGLGNDVANVTGTNADTKTSIVGGSGIDQFNVGSSLEANNGSLDELYGHLTLSGGEDNDLLYINDVGKMSSFNYAVGPTSVTNNGSTAKFFGGITYDGSVERLRLDSTNFRNDVLVTPSKDTTFQFAGGGGYNTIGFTTDPSEDGREFFGENGGDGFFTFTDGSLDVAFEDFFLNA